MRDVFAAGGGGMTPTANRIRTLRRSHGLTQVDLAKLVRNTGRTWTTVQSIYRWEHGLNYPQRPALFALARVFGVSVEWLEGKEAA